MHRIAKFALGRLNKRKDLYIIPIEFPIECDF